MDYRQHWGRQIKQGVQTENWVQLQQAISKCEQTCLLEELVQEVVESKSSMNESPKSGMSGFYHVCSRIETKHKVLQSLTEALESDDEAVLAQSLNNGNNAS